MNEIKIKNNKKRLSECPQLIVEERGKDNLVEYKKL